MNNCPRIKILFLYLQLADYTLCTIKKMIEMGSEAHLVIYPQHPAAPYTFNFPPELHVYERFDYTNSQLLDIVKNINPDLIICAGWTDAGYLKVSKYFFGKIPTVVGSDTQFKNSPKQWLAMLISRFTLLKTFSHLCGGGKLQYEYAMKLGFQKNQLLPAHYAADYDTFDEIYYRSLTKKAQSYSKRFVYVGRYLELKGVKDLWQAFVELQNESPNDWELWCLGTGDLYEQRVLHSKINHLGFVQSSAMEEYIQKTGVFIMPSHRDAWCVALHEFAAAGFPIICSHKVGAIHSFLQEGVNGYIFEAQNIQSLKQAMHKMIQKTDNELLQMGKISNQLAAHLTPQIAAQAFYDLACEALPKKY